MIRPLTLVLLALLSACSNPKTDAPATSIEERVVADATRRQPGELLMVEHEEVHDRPCLEVNILAAGGRRVLLHYDARSGDFIDRHSPA